MENKESIVVEEEERNRKKERRTKSKFSSSIFSTSNTIDDYCCYEPVTPVQEVDPVPGTTSRPLQEEPRYPRRQHRPPARNVVKLCQISYVCIYVPGIAFCGLYKTVVCYLVT